MDSLNGGRRILLGSYSVRPEGLSGYLDFYISQGFERLGFTHVNKDVFGVFIQIVWVRSCVVHYLLVLNFLTY